ncbi:hypothetical protein C0581_04695 [Candidatus Parcubacteria bacterium]|nr:MAG: hypothetical protein C0581_04695 [Candidatus Parcubacteria bacterium]
MHKYIYGFIASLTLLLLIGASCEPNPIPVERTSDTVSSTQTEEPTSTPPAYECKYDIDCSGRLMVCENFHCVPLTEEQTPDEEELPKNSPCNNNAQCISGKLCVDGSCVPAEEVLLPEEAPENSPCASQDQCIKGKMCVDGECVDAPAPSSQFVQCSAHGLNWECGAGLLCGDKASDCTYPACENTTCGSDQICTDGICLDKYTYTGTSCTHYSDCGGTIDDYVCISGQCATQYGGLRCENSTQAWGCDNDNYRCSTNPNECYRHSCSSDDHCQTGWTCYQGGCMQAPDTCNSHLECLSDEAVCRDNRCGWPGENNITCNNAYGDRWHCLNTQTCGDTDRECLDTQEPRQACSYYVDGVQQNWGCGDSQWCGTSEGECFDEPLCETADDCEGEYVCLYGYCVPAQ